MKKIFLAVALTVLVAPAMAADLRAPAYRPPPPVYVFSWTGCYVGGNVGGLWVNKEFTDLRFNDRFFGQTFNADASSWAAGVQVGCNYQFAGGWVVGFQGDYDWTDAHTDRTVFFFDEFASFKVKSVGSVTGRVGYAWDRFLGYVKGGGAWERDELTFIFDNGAIGSLSNTRTGWTVGVGGEYAFTNWLTGFVEYDYYNFGHNSDNVFCGGACLFPFEVKETKSVFKVGLNYLFGAPGPVAASRY
jgi:outer membrane immunogenic protein